MHELQGGPDINRLRDRYKRIIPAPVNYRGFESEIRDDGGEIDDGGGFEGEGNESKENLGGDYACDLWWYADRKAKRWYHLKYFYY